MTSPWQLVDQEHYAHDAFPILLYLNRIWRSSGHITCSNMVDGTKAFATSCSDSKSVRDDLDEEAILVFSGNWLIVICERYSKALMAC